MGGAQSSTDSTKPTQLAEDLRVALRTSDGPFAGEAAGQPDNKELHRSDTVLALLKNATRRDILTEHLLELVDSQWDEGHDGVPKAIGQLIRLASAEQVHVLAVTCILYQRCWLALDFALQELLMRRKRSLKRKNDDDDDDDDNGGGETEVDEGAGDGPPAQLGRLFSQACHAAPLPCLEKVLELGWTDHRGWAAGEQFRILMMRLCAQHRPLLSPEEKQRRKLQQERDKKKKAAAAVFNLAGGDEKEEEQKQLALKKKLCGGGGGGASEAKASQHLLIAFLRQLEEQPVDVETALNAMDLLPIPSEDDENEEAKIQRAAVPAEYRCDVEACDLIRATLRAYFRPWSQIEATVNETPMSWIMAPNRTRRYVCCVSLCLKKRGMTFPGWSKVLSFLATPNMEFL